MDNQSQQPTSSENDLFNLKQTCEFLNVKESKLRGMVFKNEIPVIRLGRCLRFSKTDLVQWLSQKKNYSL